ncbi:MAG: phage holin family protein [Paludibacter sp.]|nr:phage holin family protein [Paludibacter sp.]
MSEFNKFEEISDSLKQYLMLNYEIVKLQATERASVIGSSLVSSLVVGISAFLFVFTLSIGLGFYLSALLGDAYSGFAIIAAFYFLLAVVLFIGRKKIIEKPLRDKIIKKLLEN